MPSTLACPGSSHRAHRPAFRGGCLREGDHVVWHVGIGYSVHWPSAFWDSAESGADSEVVQIASGGLTPHCNTTGDDLLDFWGYKLSIGTCVGILCAFYVVFHIGSYLALSKLYKQKR